MWAHRRAGRLMISPRSGRCSRRLPEPRRLDVIEDLAQHRHAVRRGRAVDGERGLDAEARRVCHREEAALHALVEDDARDLAGERLLRLLVAHELDAEEEAAPVDLADEGVVVHEEAEAL